MVYIIELSGILFLFIFLIAPMGTMVIAAFLALIGTFGRGKVGDTPSEVNLGKISFKGPLRLGLITLALIFAVIALRDSEDRTARSNSGSSYENKSVTRTAENNTNSRKSYDDTQTGPARNVDLDTIMAQLIWNMIKN